MTDISSPEGRVQEILNLIPLDHLDRNKIRDVVKLVKKFPSMFKLEQDTFKATKVELVIPLKTEKIINQPQYTLPKHFEEAAFKQVREWERLGVVEPSYSPYNIPIFAVLKKGINKDGTPKVRVAYTCEN